MPNKLTKEGFYTACLREEKDLDLYDIIPPDTKEICSMIKSAVYEILFELKRKPRNDVLILKLFTGIAALTKIEYKRINSQRQS
jgi:hypothetical protein